MESKYLKVGMKVKIPKTKSVWGPVSGSCTIKKALENNQDYLYFTGIDEKDGYILLDNEKDTSSGDFFLPQDIELYEEEKRTSKKPMYTIKELEERDDLVIYLDSQEEFNKLSTITNELTTIYYGKHCYSLYHRNYSSWSDKTDTGSYEKVRIIQIDQIKELNLEKEIIGYKLIKPEYSEPASMIVFGNEAGILYMEADRKSYVDKLKKAGVLDLWFEPVYKKEEFFKKGDWVSFEGISGKIITTQVKDWTSLSYYKLKNGLEPPKHLIRKATPEEIKNATEVSLVLSNNHKVIVGLNKIIASNSELNIKDIKNLIEPLGTLGKSAWDIDIESIKIGCWENITREDLKLIIRTYEEIN